jgi:hypothetical protein
MTREDTTPTGAERADTRDDDSSVETGDEAGELPHEVADEAERLTRLARDAVDDNAAAAYRERRDDLLAEHGFTARIRGEEAEATLVLHPSSWVVDGDVHPDRIEDTGRAVERPLEGAGEADDWDAVDEHNAAVAERVAEAHGEVHGENARAFATFMSNHYARPLEQATQRMREEFLTDYFPRNAWPDDDQRAAVAESLELIERAAAEESR